MEYLSVISAVVAFMCSAWLAAIKNNRMTRAIMLIAFLAFVVSVYRLALH